MLKQVIEIMDLLDDAYITGERVAALLKEHGVQDIQESPSLADKPAMVNQAWISSPS